MIKIRNTENCGLLIQIDKTKVLIDAMNGICPDFSTISSEDANAIYDGTGDFSNIDCMLFTHCHLDHYDRKKVLRCMESNNVKRILIPDKEEYEALSAAALSGGSKVLLYKLDMEFGKRHVLSIPKMKIICFRTRHSGKQYYDISHYSYFILANEKGIYISGDCDFTDYYQSDIVEGVQVFAGFFNPYYLSSRQGRNFLYHSHIQRIYIYHIPRECDDSGGIRSLAMRSLRQYGNLITECKLLLSCGEWIEEF